MGFFKLNLEKNGPGVPEDGTKAPMPIRFFGILKRKFWGMLVLNLMELIAMIPALIIGTMFLTWVLPIDTASSTDFTIAVRCFGAFMATALQVVTVGPLHAGFIYCLRNYVREENAFLWSDFMKGIRENWKSAIAVSLINMLVFAALIFTYVFYLRYSVQLGSMGQFCRAILLVMAVVFLMATMYIYPMMVTLRLNIRQLYGNAIRFALARFIPNLGILLANGLCFALLSAHILVEILAIPLIGFVLPCYLSTFFAYPAIDRHIIGKHQRDRA